jgi:periplasmic copper chaperone A
MSAITRRSLSAIAQIPIIALLSIFLATLAHAGDGSAQVPVTVTAGWVRAMPPGTDSSAAYMTFTNTGDKPERITGGATEIGKMVMPMIGTKQIIDGKEVAGMQATDALVVPPHGSLVLQPGGDHLMIMGLTTHPRPGDQVHFTVQFDGGGTLQLLLPVSIDTPGR